jgi:hypothetical protein
MLIHYQVEALLKRNASLDIVDGEGDYEHRPIIHNALKQKSLSS